METLRVIIRFVIKKCSIWYCMSFCVINVLCLFLSALCDMSVLRRYWNDKTIGAASLRALRRHLVTTVELMSPWQVAVKWLHVLLCFVGIRVKLCGIIELWVMARTYYSSITRCHWLTLGKKFGSEMVSVDKICHRETFWVPGLAWDNSEEAIHWKRSGSGGGNRFGMVLG